ncbi:BRI1 kinase inhibitor 1-like [Hibiscus syriacus]|uniref:BRI1 kinase inhibitor 1-like n=1 Tax=Hibiscus syriacus TaxID=106335 RepID=UPI001921E1E0|nr:BRI1 kinase inhibitor 1-like [Hibiscus syriacus]
MDTYHHQHEEEEEEEDNDDDNEEDDEEEGKLKEETKEGSSSTLSPNSAPSPSSTSPCHEFSFRISLHSSSDYKTKTPSSIAVDLSPADDIFFHGHLLPLHLLSHLPVSPRLSTSSSDGFNFPGRELFYDLKSVKPINKSDGNIQKHERLSHGYHHQSHAIEAKVKNKSNSFSLFGLKRQQKGSVKVRETEEKENDKKKMRFNVLNKYTRMIRPFLFFRRKRENLHLHRQAYSFSGNLRNKKTELRGRRGGDYYSAPPSIRTSPSNSGLLVATKGHPCSTSESTTEELQAAIQSAIAHCKNSIKGEDKLKSQA